MREQTLLEWAKRVGNYSKKFRFDDVLALFYNIISLENTPKDKISVKTQSLLDAYLFEKSKADAIRDWQREQDENK